MQKPFLMHMIMRTGTSIITLANEHRLQKTSAPWKKKPMTCVTCCDFNDFVKAMADETRQRILTLLQSGEMNESDIVARLELTQPTISHHLALLRHANLVTARREGKYVFYRANPDCVSECCGEIMSRYNTRHREAQNSEK